MSIATSRSAADAASERLKVYAQPQRLMILSHLLAGEFTVSDIDTATGIGQPALSQQLAELRRAEIVRTRKAAKQVFYRLANETVVTCVKAIEAMFGDGGGHNAPHVQTETLARQQATPVPRATPDRLPARNPGAAAFPQIG